jgi:hypothetical protein
MGGIAERIVGLVHGPKTVLVMTVDDRWTDWGFLEMLGTCSRASALIAIITECRPAQRIF